MNIHYSIIIPTFNSSRDLKCLLESLARTEDEMSDVEILVVDDGSYDDTPSVVSEFRDRIDNLHYHYQKNRGPAAARNLGVEHACGRFVIFVDVDCLIPNGCINAIRVAYQQNPSFDAFGVKTICSSTSVFSRFNQR